MLICLPSVELAAEFLSRPQSQEVVEGEKAEFSCSVSKDSYEVKWLRGDKELQTDEKYEIISDGKRRVLRVKDCQRVDEGPFVALIGATRASAELTVLGMHSTHPTSRVPCQPIRTHVFLIHLQRNSELSPPSKTQRQVKDKRSF